MLEFSLFTHLKLRKNGITTEIDSKMFGSKNKKISPWKSNKVQKYFKNTFATWQGNTGREG